MFCLIGLSVFNTCAFQAIQDPSCLTQLELLFMIGSILQLRLKGVTPWQRIDESKVIDECRGIDPLMNAHRFNPFAKY